MATKITETRENKTEIIKSGLSIEQAFEELKSLGQKIRNESRDTIDINYINDFSFNAIVNGTIYDSERVYINS